MNKIKEISLDSRPRELALKYGVSSLSNIEILSLILGSGIKNKSVLDISNEILLKSISLDYLFKLDYSFLNQIKGLSKAKILKLLACFELAKRRNEELNEILLSKDYDPFLIYKEMVDNSFLLENEILIILGYRNRKRILKRVLCQGNKVNMNTSLENIKDVLINNKIDTFILIHNHLGDIIKPSNQDLTATMQIEEVASNLKIKFLDHLIISNSDYFSFMKHDLLGKN